MKPVTSTLRASRVLINETAILHNVQHAIAALPKGTDLFAVVKADAYGHGLLRVARVAKKAGATGFCVATLDEALALRQAHYVEPVLVLGIVDPEYAGVAAVNHIAVPVGDLNWLHQALPYLKPTANRQALQVHMAIDSGMGRIGFSQLADFKAALALVAQFPTLMHVEGIFTHFATADEVDTTYFEQQTHRFKHFLDAMTTKPRYVHVSNSATSLWHAACNGNMIRFGVAMYGLNPSGRGITALPYPLEPAMSLVANLVFVKQVPKGTAISYGATYHAKEDEWIGTLPLGYADGWLRRMQGFSVLVDGQRCEIVGRICMDQFMIRLPKAYPVGTQVVLVGQSGDQTISLQDVADYSETIHYEVACLLDARLPRLSVAPVGD